LEETGGFRDNLVIISGDVPLIGLEFIFGLVPDLFLLADFVAWKISMIHILFVALARINVFSKPVLDLSVCVAGL
jgi:hypothetical protein